MIKGSNREKAKVWKQLKVKIKSNEYDEWMEWMEQ